MGTLPSPGSSTEGSLILKLALYLLNVTISSNNHANIYIYIYNKFNYFVKTRDQPIYTRNEEHAFPSLTAVLRMTNG